MTEPPGGSGLGTPWLWCIPVYLLATVFLVRATARWLREGGPSAR